VCSRLVLADDNGDFRLLLSLALRNTTGLEVAGEAADGAEAIDRAVELHPDAVILDLDMPGTSGWEAIPEIRRRAPESKIVVYSAMVVYASDEQSLIDLGADAVLTKDRTVPELREALISVVGPCPGGD